MMRSLAFVAVLLTGCVPPTIMQANLSPADVQLASASLAAPGTGVIKGSALLRQNGGGVVTCAGNPVYLIPATESAATEMARIFGGGTYLNNGADGLGGGTWVTAPEPNRSTVCNPQGFFTFDKVQNGRWFVMTTVIWAVGENNQGGTLLATSEVEGGTEAPEIVMTN